MKIEFDVHMTVSAMYDYMLYHTMHSFTGILGEFIGIFLIAGFIFSKQPIYLIAGIVVVFYLPVSLYINAKRQVMLNPVFKNPIHFTLDEEGITVSVLEQSESQKWEDMRKAVSTGRSIIIYTNKINASIFPKVDLAEKLPDVIKMISTHMDAKKVFIRTMG